jgi:hypothetical protein
MSSSPQKKSMKKSVSSKREGSAPPGVPIKDVKISVVYDLSAHEIFTLGELCDMEADVGFRQIFRHAPKATFTFEGDYSDKVFKNARGWLESSNAQTQCGNVIPDWKEDDSCYICGLPFGRDPGNSPECEHILPVFQASCFLTLYKSNYGRRPTEDVYRTIRDEKEKHRIRNLWKEMDLEYAWSHRCCNQLKSDWSFLKYNNEEGVFEFDEKTCKILLDSIAKGRNLFGKDGSKWSMCSNLSKLLTGQSYKTWLNARIQSILKRQIEPICDYLNTSKKDVLPGLYYLSIVSNVINATDAKFRNAAMAEAAGSAQLVPPPPEESLFKASVYKEVAESIANTMLASGSKWDLRAVAGRGLEKYFIQSMNILFPRSKERVKLEDVGASPGFATIDKTKMVSVVMKAILTMNQPRPSILLDSNGNMEDSEFTADALVRDIVSLAPIVDTSLALIPNDRENYEKQNTLYNLVSSGLHLFIYWNILKNIQRLEAGGIDPSNGGGVADLKSFVESRISDIQSSFESHPRVYLLTSYLISKIDTTFSDPLVKYQDIPELVNNNIIRTRYEYWREQIDKHGKTADEMAATISNLASISINTLIALSQANIDEIMADDDIAVKPSEKKIVKDTVRDSFHELGDKDVSEADVMNIASEILGAAEILTTMKNDRPARQVAPFPGQFPEGEGRKRPSMMGKGSKKTKSRTKKTNRRNRKTRKYNT